MYAPMLAWYLQYFDTSDILILSFEDMHADPIHAANRISHHAGLGDIYTRRMMYDSKGRLKKGL